MAGALRGIVAVIAFSYASAAPGERLLAILTTRRPEEHCVCREVKTADPVALIPG